MLNRILLSLPYVLATGFVVRLATILFIDFSTFNWSKPRPDLLMEYGVIAKNLAQGLGYSYTWYTSAGAPITLPSAYMPPGLVFLEYGIIELFGYTTAAVVALFLLQVLMGCACIWLVGNITQKIFGLERVSAAARWIMALYPPFVYLSMSFGVTMLVLFLSLVILYTALELVASPRAKSSIKVTLLLGISCGAFMLSRGEGPLIVLMTFLVLAIKSPGKRKRLALAGAIACMIIAPWIVRNFVVFDRFIPISTNGSLNFWRGNNPITSGSPLNEGGDPIWSTDEIWRQTEPYLATGAEFEGHAASVYQTAAFDWIREHPLDAGVLALKKGLLFWTFDLRNKLSGWVYIILHSLLLMLTLAGLWRLMRKRERLPLLSTTGISLILAWAALATVIAMIFLPLIRFQVITMALLLPFAAYGIPGLARSHASTR